MPGGIPEDIREKTGVRSRKTVKAMTRVWILFCVQQKPPEGYMNVSNVLSCPFESDHPGEGSV